MEDDTRQFQPVNIGMATVEKGCDRFSSDGIFAPPALSHWRNNLTALSQRYNLYFLAVRSHVAVYVPDFPFQQLRRNPILFLPPTVANPAAEGYIDPTHPHAINHLIVGDLGTEEILLVATDSGNIAAYHTKSIEEAVKKCTSSIKKDEAPISPAVRAFFCHWVHESAWGLAIHRNARMIAISANVPVDRRSHDKSAKITVFAFALTAHTSSEIESSDSESHTGNASAEWHTWKPDISQPTRPDRNQNYKIVLRGLDGHEYNIPSISFINTAEDSDGMWILSTDIGGELRAWQIWNGRCYKTWDFSGRETDSFFAWSARNRRHEGGWLIAALDGLAFRPTDTMDEFCGWPKAPRYQGYTGVGDSYDISNIVRSRVPGNSQVHPALRGFENTSEGEPVRTGSDVEVFLSSDEADSNDGDAGLDFNELNLQGPRQQRDIHLPGAEHGFSGQSSNIAARRTIRRSSGRSNSSEHTTDSSEDESEQGSRDDETAPPYFDPQEIISSPPLGDIYDRQDEMVDSDNSEAIVPGEYAPEYADANGLGTLDLEATDSLHSAEEAEDDWVLDEAANAESNSSAPDVLSEAGVHLRRHSKISREVERAYIRAYLKADRQGMHQRYGRVPSVPLLHCSTSHLRLLQDPAAETAHVFCSQVLKQLLPPFIEGAQSTHLDRLNMLQQIPELGVVIIATQVGRCAVCTLTRRGRDGQCGIRVDWILPSGRQEQADQRPFSSLLGIAVGPVQGRMVENRRSPISNYDVDEAFSEDRTVSGVPISFDPNVVVLGRGPSNDTNNCNNDNSIIDEDDPAVRKSPGRPPSSPKMKRKRSFPQQVPKEAQQLGTLKVERRPWRRPEVQEEWRGKEHSRRYRLMMTYRDQTVMVYELWRDPPESGMESDNSGVRKTLRNRKVF